jgi:hypothetical protein
VANTKRELTNLRLRNELVRIGSFLPPTFAGRMTKDRQDARIALCNEGLGLLAVGDVEGARDCLKKAKAI